MSRQSREKIIESSIKILFRSPQCTMDQLADNLQISRATLYRYFKTKQEILKEITISSHEIFKRTIEAAMDCGLSGDEKLGKFIKDFVPTGARFYFLTFNDLFFDDKNIQELYRDQSKMLEKFCKVLKDEGAIDLFVPEEWFASSLEYLIYAVWERVHQGDLAVNKAADLVINTFLNGLGNKKR